MSTPKLDQPLTASEIRELFSLTQKLMAFDSTTGQEAAVVQWLEGALKQRGYQVVRQAVQGDRGNLLAYRGQPRVVLTTHLDCVPPFISPTETETHHLGRGACDAKGIAAAMIAAADHLHSADLGLLFVVGEETDSIGAKAFAKEPPASASSIRFLIDGEPTQNRLCHGHKGVFAFRVKRKGVPGHSAYPEEFPSALHPLIDELATLLKLPLPADANYGTTTVNVGTLRGGKAPNVMAEEAEAQVVVRLARPLSEVEPLVRSAFGPETELEVRTKSDPSAIYVPGNHPSEIVRFGTDVPHLKPLGQVLLVGPGSIHDAHTAGEKLAKADQLAAVAIYRNLVLELQDQLVKAT